MPKCSETGKNKQDKPWVESCGNVFKDIGFDDEEAAHLLARTDLMLQIRNTIQERNLTQVEAAKILKVRQPRIAEIKAMKIQLYSVDTLLKYLARLGTQVSFQFKKSDVA
jgi:predicted XRE-type DNA-binding protein